MKYRFSVLNVAAGGLVLLAVVTGALNFKNLTEGEGWGMAAVLMAIFVGFSGLLINLVLQGLIKNPYLLNVIEGLTILVFFLYLFYH